ncbi:putative membrane protein YqjE [Clostridium acetobutylicum]|uniref:Predicted membrane protein CF-9 family n=1 Tax=Clostridium acetobutylicum (strain ATCC 824 / DSM 792 / JCM 1419 / IAM 19013 / LMG 5710 / NBRC 13948 / NRRL B-527 / VKM B-1787 / 2291 / W) TaxID=272562 RepID=Q97L41_CLOAB|nr:MULTISPECIES: HXXEE domain-containing protein [Clostridium]AAK78701.1 Predicted membrane protein; CF-9 family [Clostridium acetobutylicum ATCC 824]AEI31396.1 hypothetical protein SMB_G0741 [Clostridium acetobutylicum DSM 1731]AWV80420.1 HXXEE domain-containing protein [Clostridium acetobutylicum]MBC2392610.1 HXXEE domain-containing protein [Clostridium acetobutylicum]MBC2584438.1 HXXEE domain-containing protein [Clostridium acetobutylicum]
MNKMNAIAWLLPILFMIHDFEEIIFVKVWRQKYQYCLDASAMKKKPFSHFKSTDEFSIGVEIIFVILSLITLISIIFNDYHVWYGFIFTITAHFITAHFKGVLEFKHYVPGFVTSILFLPLNAYIIYIVTAMLRFNAVDILISCVLGAAVGFFIYTFLHSMEKNFANKLIEYSINKIEK